MKPYKILFLFFWIPILLSAQQAEKPGLFTFYEKSGFLETPRYDKTIRFCKQLAEASPWVHYTSFGISNQGRELPLLIVDNSENFEPEKVRKSGKVVLLVQACIHAGEPDGKDAGLTLIRDLVILKKNVELLDKVTLLFIPIFNVDGHERFGPYNRINQNGPKEMGWRTNAQNLNLNRDYLKAETPEIQSWVQLFNDWLPDFFVDCHVTDGADYQYALTYGMEVSGDMDAALTQWQKEKYLKPIEILMNNAGIPIVPYVDFRNWHDPRSGLETWASPPMFSQGYCAIQNRPGLLIETHMLKDYKTRVTATYEMLKNTMLILNKESKNLQKLVQETDKKTASPEFKKTPLPLRFETSAKDSTYLDFLGFEYSGTKSDLSGGDWFQYSKEPKTFSIPYFSTLKVKSQTTLPEAYIIPAEWKAVIEKVRLHGVQTQMLTRQTTIKVYSYRFKNYKFRSSPYEGHQTVETDLDSIQQEVTYPAGSVIVPTNQRTAILIAHLLEPKAPSSLLWWGYFNTIFEQKEYSESYVMEAMAREMIKNDPKLLQEFEEKKKSDSAFAKSPQEILNWFYRKTPYWDNHKDLYPIGKIYDINELNKLNH